MDRAQKEQAVSQMKEIFSNANTVVVSHYRGMTVDETSQLRHKARENGANVKVTKNTLARIAANDTDFAVIADLLSGPTAITFSEDAVAAAKTAVDYAKDNEKLVILGGAFEGNVLDEAGVKALASTPSLDASRAKIVGLLNAPASQLVRLLQTPGGQLARVMGAHGSQES